MAASRLVIASSLFVVVAGAGGYLAGSSSAADQADADEARQQAFIDAKSQARERSFEQAAQDAGKEGLAQGERLGKEAGTQEGARAGADRVDEQLDEIALAEQTAAAAEPLPGTAGSDVCVAFQDYVPGVGCVPPVAPGETQAPINCPPGTVPVGTTGACGRP